MSISTSGICGIVGPSSQKETLQNIASGMRIAKHTRNRESYIDDSVCFYSMSSEDGRQNVVKNEEGTIVAIINGDISNALEVRRQLESEGHVFSSDFDHEVFVHLFENIKVDPYSFRIVNGAFSFAIWDSVEKRLVLGLDKFGMRALYYGVLDGNLLFASELKGIANYSSEMKKINPLALRMFFSYFYVPTENTLIDGVKRVMPACYKIFSLNRSPALQKFTKYWQPNQSSFAMTNNASFLADEIYTILLKSVKEKLGNAQTTVGVSLSGGLDSGLLSTLLRRLDRKVVAFVIAMEGGEQNDAYLVAESNGSDVEEIFVSSEDYIENLGKIAAILDEPISEWALVPIYLIGKRAREKVDVLFTGDGADEAFWGDPTVPRRWFSPFLSATPRPIKNVLNSILNSNYLSQKRQTPIFHDASIDNLYEMISLSASDLFFVDSLKKCNPDDLQVTDPVLSMKDLTGPITTCFNEIQTKSDLAKRYHTLLRIDFPHSGSGVRPREEIYNYYGIKCAMPFMDEEVIRLSYSIPPHLKQPTRNKSKYVIRKMIAQHNLLPEKMIKIRKRAMGDQFDSWESGKMLREFMMDELEEGHRLGIIKKDFVSKARRGIISPGKCFGIVTFALWYKDFFGSG